MVEEFGGEVRGEAGYWAYGGVDGRLPVPLGQLLFLDGNALICLLSERIGGWSKKRFT